MTKIFPIRREDAAPAGLLAVHLFLSVASIVLGKAARDAIFLSRYTPQQMTAVDIATMVAAALVVGAQLRLNGRVSTKWVLLISPLCFALGDVALWFGVSTSSGGSMIRLAYLWIGIQGSFGAPQASVLACHVLTSRRAKRLCGVIGSGAILGWIGGGLLTQRLAAHFGASSLLLASGALTALCPLVVSLVWHDGSDTLQETARDHSQHAAGLHRSASVVWTSPHLRAIACLALVSSAVTTIVGLEFKIMASRSIVASDHLAAFFGSFSFHAGLVALATQVLLTSRIVETFGIGPALMIAPAALAAGSVGILVSGTLAAAVFLKGSDQVLRYSVDRAAVELLYRPLSQGEIFEGKTFIDALVCRLGDAIGGTIALFGAIVLRLSLSWLSVISLALLLGWLASAGIARRNYRVRLRENLRLQPHVSDAAWRSETAGLPLKPFDRRTPAQRDVMHVDPEKRLHALRSLTRVRACRRHAGFDKRLLTTALAAEIVGFAVLVETSSGSDACSTDDRGAGRDTIERILRLLFLIAPDRYPDCVRCALGSGNPAYTATALEYLDITLPSPHRQVLRSLFERWPPAVI